MQSTILHHPGLSLRRVLVAFAVTVALALPAVAQAAGADGTGPQTAIPLTGTISATLAPGQVVWYRYYHDANLNDALTLKSNPAIPLTLDTNGNTGYTSGVFFNVEWSGLPSDQNFPGGKFQQDWPNCYRVAQSTQSQLDDGSGPLPAGTQYWQQTKSNYSNTFAIEVVNASASPTSYALTLAQSDAAVSASDNALPAPSP